MAENQLPNEQTKEINGVTLTNKEISKIAMICDYLVLDRFNDISSFIRFEKCFGPLLSKEDPQLLVDAFHEICGPKRKYITFGRLILAYTKWKSNSSKNENFNKFMKIVFNDMIKEENEVIGKLEEGTRIFSTKNTRGRKVISKFGVFTDTQKNIIKGFYIQYDDFFVSTLCTKNKEGDDKNITLEMNFPPNGKTILDRDGISHIAGKFSVANKHIKFLIFKCRSGKTFYIGDNTQNDDEQIELFIFGTSSCQLKTLRIETINDKLAYLEPKFQPSMRVNQKIVPFDGINEKYIDENIINNKLIFEENEIQNIPLETIDLNTLLIPCITDDAFINDKKSLSEPICGKDLNEIYTPYLQRKNEKEEQKEEKKEEPKEETNTEQKVDDKEKKELKNKILIQTIKRVSLMKYFIKKFKVRENLLVLKNKNKQEEERINMDKYLAKIKIFKKKMDKKKKSNEIKLEKEKNEKEEYDEKLENYEQEEDWPDEDKKEENGENEEKKEDEKVEDKKEEEKVEIKVEVPVIQNKEENTKVEENKIEDKKEENIKLEDNNKKNIDSEDIKVIEVEDNESEKKKKKLKSGRPRKLINKRMKNAENIPKQEEKKEEIEDKKEEEKKVELEEKKEEIPEKKEEIEKKIEIEEPKEEKIEKIEDKIEEKKEEIIKEKKEEIINKNEIIEDKKEEIKENKNKIIMEKKEEKIEEQNTNIINEKTEEKKKEDKDINLVSQIKLENNNENNLNDYEKNKLKDDEKEGNLIPTDRNKGFCSNCEVS